MKHYLKCYGQYYEAVASGIKTFEIRKNDRNFQVGDRIVLCERKDSEFTGAKLEKVITYITDFPAGLKEGYVVLGIKTPKSFLK